MESEERPTKMRKLSHEKAPENDVATLPASGSDEQITPDTKNDSTDQAETNAIPAPDQVAPLATESSAQLGDPPLSKSQQKKLRKKAEWESKRGERKAIRKQKIVTKRERKREEKQQAIEQGIPLPAAPPKVYQASAQLPITFLVDCDFDDLMRDNERISLASQITRCYSDNKNALYRAHLTWCSFGGKLKERFDTVLEKNYERFRGVRTFDSDFMETAEKAKEWMTWNKEGGQLKGVFSKYADLDEAGKQKLKDEGEVVYLTSEATDDLMELKPYSTYIIGGLVDKNREKGICYKRATRAGVKTAKLPIGEFMDMQSRKVLATNHVNEIMIRWLECGDWGEAFEKVIPKRKGGKLKGDKGGKEDGGDDEEEAEDDGEGDEEGGEEGEADVNEATNVKDEAEESIIPSVEG